MFEAITGFLVANWISVLLVVGFIVLCYIMLKKGYRKNVALWCYILVTKAEDKFGAGTGDIKYASVLEGLYDKFPSVIRFFFSLSEIDDLIEDAVDSLQDYLLNQSK